MDQNRNCLHCGDLLKGRADKKFCDDNCRNNFNNKINSVDHIEIRGINNILKRNRRILSSMVNGNGKIKVDKLALYEKGFNFLYHTHTSAGDNDCIYKLCYDYAYHLIDDKSVIVVKWE